VTLNRFRSAETNGGPDENQAAEYGRRFRSGRSSIPLQDLWSLSCYIALETVVVLLFLPMLLSLVQAQAMNYMRTYASGDIYENCMNIERLSSKTEEDDARPIRSSSY